MTGSKGEDRGMDGAPVQPDPMMPPPVCWCCGAEQTIDAEFAALARRLADDMAWHEERQARHHAVLAVPCRRCGAEPGQGCRTTGGRPTEPHERRRVDAGVKPQMRRMADR